MDPFFIPIIALCVPAVGIASLAVSRFMKLRERQIDVAASLAAEKAALYAANGAVMEQRIRLLERIVIDEDLDLSDELDRPRGLTPETMRRH